MESGSPPNQAHMTLRQVVMLLSAIGISTAGLVHLAHRLLPTPNGSIGYDYGYHLPYLLSGVEWIRRNGWLSIPYFTPDYCGGIPWLANPISDFYSVPQILTYFSGDPVAAIRWTLFLSAAAGGAAAYLLLRRCFGVSSYAAGLGFVLFQLNGFLTLRVAAGVLPYHTFGLVPALCLCALATDAPDRRVFQWNALSKDVASGIAGACLLAVMVYGGAAPTVIPAVLCASAIILLHQAIKGFRARPWLILAAACVWAIPLSAFKLIPAYIFITGYPRPYVGHFLFDNPLRLARSLLESLFVPEMQPFFTNFNRVFPSTVNLNELEFGVSVVPLFLITAGLFVAYRSRRLPRHVLPATGLALIVAIPIFGAFGNETWGHILMRLPIINNNAMLTRWWSIYILILIVLAALSFDQVVSRRVWVRDAVFAACVIAAAAQLTLRSVEFYTNGTSFLLYDPAPVAAAVRQVLVDPDSLPAITQLGPPAITHSPSLPPLQIPDENNGLLSGISALPCYEPVFGHAHELFPARGLQTGPLDRAAPGFVNLADPRCYLYARPNACRPGDQFHSGEQEDVVAFTSHRPLAWQQPEWQSAARMATIICLGFSLMVLVAFGVFQLFQWQCTLWIANRE